MIEVWRVKDRRMVKIKAFSSGVPGLMVHPRLGEEDLGWDITHVASGLAIAVDPYSPWPDKAVAQRAAKVLARLADWTKPSEDIVGFGFPALVLRAIEKEFGWPWWIST